MGLLGWIRTCEQESPCGGIRIASPYLLAVYDEMISVQAGASLQVRQIGSSVRLAVELRPLHATLGDFREQLLLLILGAEFYDY